MISDLALKVKESDGLPGRVIRKSDTISRGHGLSLVSNAAMDHLGLYRQTNKTDNSIMFCTQILIINQKKY